MRSVPSTPQRHAPNESASRALDQLAAVLAEIACAAIREGDSGNDAVLPASAGARRRHRHPRMTERTKLHLKLTRPEQGQDKNASLKPITPQRASKATQTSTVDYGAKLDGPSLEEQGDPSGGLHHGRGCPRHRGFVVPPPDNADRRKTDPP